MTVRRHLQRCDFGSEIRRQMPGTWPRRHFFRLFLRNAPAWPPLKSRVRGNIQLSGKSWRWFSKMGTPYRRGLGGGIPKQAGFWAVFAKFHEDLRLNGHCRYSQMWKIECTKGHYYFTGFTLL